MLPSFYILEKWWSEFREWLGIVARKNKCPHSPVSHAPSGIEQERRVLTSPKDQDQRDPGKPVMPAVTLDSVFHRRVPATVTGAIGF